MEALRALRRERSKCPGNAGTTACEIVEYISRNFRVDGDVDAQVRTALRRAVCNGFVKSTKAGYDLVGPYACPIRNAERGNVGKSTPSIKPPPTPKRNCQGDTLQDSAEVDPPDPPSPREDIAQRQFDQGNDRQTQRRQSVSKSDKMILCPSVKSQRRSCSASPRRRRRSSSRRTVPRERPRSSGSNADCSSCEAVGEVLNPARHIELAEFDHNCCSDCDEPIEIPGSSDSGDDDLESIRSDDSAFREISREDETARNSQERNKELKRWIRNCRRECEKRTGQNA